MDLVVLPDPLHERLAHGRALLGAPARGPGRAHVHMTGSRRAPDI
jgi:hypothetical protein